MFCVGCVQNNFCEQFFISKKGQWNWFWKLVLSCYVEIGKMSSFVKKCIGKNADETLIALCPLAVIFKYLWNTEIDEMFKFLETNASWAIKRSIWVQKHCGKGSHFGVPFCSIFVKQHKQYVFWPERRSITFFFFFLR